MKTAAANLRSSKPRVPQDCDLTLRVRRIRLGRDKPSTAVEDAGESCSLPLDAPEPATPDELDIIELPASGEMRDKASKWLEPKGRADAPPLTVNMKCGTIRWRPGRATVEFPADRCPELIRALVTFARIEGQLRRLELELLPYEQQAHADIPFSYRIRLVHRTQWNRLGETMEHLSKMRLQFARLASEFVAPSPAAVLAERLSFSRLLKKARVPDRLEAFSDRLEACEDLYDGALDRIAEFRGYHMGEWLEIIIIVLLAAEVLVNTWHVAGL